MNKILFISCWILLLIACSNGDDARNNNENALENEEIEINNNEVNDDEDAGEEENNEVSSERFEPGDEVVIEAVVDVSEDKEEVVVSGETNLVSGTFLLVELKADPFEVVQYIDQDYQVEIQADGTFSTTLAVDEVFFEEYNARPAIVEVTLDMSQNQAQDMKEIYGDKGENFAGLLVHQKNGGNQMIYNSAVFAVEGGENTYEMAMPKASDTPADYGETEVWMEVDIVGNDHHFIYLEGQSNLLEGIVLMAGYYPSKDGGSMTGALTHTTIKPNGTFTLPISYESIIDSGLIRIEGFEGMVSNEMTKEVYGEKLEHITGDIVNEDLGQKRILLEINNDGKDISVPENSLLTEEDGEYKIRVPDDVLFDFDKSDLKAPAKKTLDEVIDLLEAVEAEEVVQVIGHTDDQGADDYNLKLSEKRAEAVEAYLLENGDVNHLTFEAIGYGKTKPIESNQTEEGQQKNRRVEIIFKSNE